MLQCSPAVSTLQTGKVLLDKDPAHCSSQGHFPSRVPTGTPGCGPLRALLSAQLTALLPPFPEAPNGLLAIESWSQALPLGESKLRQYES